MPDNLYALTQAVSLICDARGIEAGQFWDVCRGLIASVRPDPDGWAGSRPPKEAVVNSFRQAHTLYERLTALLVQEAQADTPETETGASRTVAWDANDPAYIPASEAIVTFTQSKLTLSTLSKLLTADGPIRYMRQGRRCRVNLADFRAWAQKEYPPDAVRQQIVDEVLADRAARQEDIDRQKLR